jgi:hypothetical protein
MLDITEWLEELGASINQVLDKEPEKPIEILKLLSEKTDTPVDAVFFMMQATFLILLSFDENPNWEEEPSRAGLLPAIFYLCEQWAEDQLALADEIKASKQVPGELMDEIYDIINNRGNQNGSTPEQPDRDAGNENPAD